MVNIRVATPNDIEKIESITKRAFRMYQDAISKPIEVKALTEKKEDILFDINNNYVFVATIFDNVVGCIRFKLLSANLAYIYRFGVDPEINNIGIGTKLIDAVIEKSTDLGVKAIALHTNSRYYKLARYYYGKQFYVHSTTFDRGYIRALFVKELTTEESVDLSPSFSL